jgi:hypothetical protein
MRSQAYSDEGRCRLVPPLTVECERPNRWAAAFSDPATRTASTTRTSRSEFAIAVAANAVLAVATVALGSRG